MKNKYDLIIFDCDGTLVDTEELHAAATVELLLEEGLKGYDFETVYNRFIGLQFSKMLGVIAQETGYAFPKDMSDRYVARVAQNAPKMLKPVPGAHEFIARAKDTHKICVGSNGQRDNVIGSVRLGGFEEFFPDHKIFTAMQVKNPKPAPDLFLHAAEKMQAAPSKTLVLEDSETGVKAAIAAGMDVIGFTGCHIDDGTYAGLLKKAGAAHIVKTYADLSSRFF
jgi:HAD superfamily hydrolase (TIGR01509 family)